MAVDYFLVLLGHIPDLISRREEEKRRREETGEVRWWAGDHL
jgi:hypothetical protein